MVSDDRTILVITVATRRDDTAHTSAFVWNVTAPEHKEPHRFVGMGVGQQHEMLSGIGQAILRYLNDWPRIATCVLCGSTCTGAHGFGLANPKTVCDDARACQQRLIDKHPGGMVFRLWDEGAGTVGRRSGGDLSAMRPTRASGCKLDATC